MSQIVYRDRTVCRQWAALVLVLMFWVPVPTHGAQSEGNRREQVRGWIRLLADPEPATRADARRALLGLQRDELPLLREVVASMQPLKPAQAQPLEEVVTYVLTRAAINDLPQASEAFLGVSLPSAYDVYDRIDFEAEEPSEFCSDTQGYGVPIASCLNGFVAYRYLEDGDVIEAVRISGVLQPTPNVTVFRNAIRNARVGQKITLRVRRGARVLDVTFALDAKKVVDPIELQDTIQSAQNSAWDYWHRQFAPLVDGDES